MTKKTKLKIIAVISILAFFNAFYLSSDWLFGAQEVATQTAGGFYPIGSETVGSKFCDINETYSCTTVLQNEAAQIFGVPFPVLAMVVYPIILIITILGLLGRMKNYFGWLASLGLGGILFNGYFIFQETFVIKAFCPLCLICSAIIITIFILSFLEVRKECKLKKIEKNKDSKSEVQTETENIEENNTEK